MAKPVSDDPDDPNITMTVAGREITIRDRYETASIVNDALIAVEFLVGSFFFFEGVTDKDVGVWLFVVGSAQLAIRPAIRLSRRFTLRRLASQGRGYHESADDF
jgi:YrhK-like protein